ncbi:MAG: hypothetical protein KJN66_03955 [Bacteroidia bacterium]|nr:hypothetical protein [Bacteroidia bacterium]
MNKNYNLITGIIISIIPVIISAMGGAMMVYSSYDDSPGGSLLGLILVLVSIYLVIKKKTATH